VVIFVMLSGRSPFRRETLADTNKSILKVKYSFEDTCWNTVAPEAKSLIRQLLRGNPKSRLTASAVLSHPWVQQSTSKSSAGAESKSALDLECVADETYVSPASESFASFSQGDGKSTACSSSASSPNLTLSGSELKTSAAAPSPSSLGGLSHQVKSPRSSFGKSEPAVTISLKSTSNLPSAQVATWGASLLRPVVRSSTALDTT